MVYKLPVQVGRIQGMPDKASHPVQCSTGGKHVPVTHEIKRKVEGHMKYTLCTKCGKIP